MLTATTEIRRGIGDHRPSLKALPDPLALTIQPALAIFQTLRLWQLQVPPPVPNATIVAHDTQSIVEAQHQCSRAAISKSVVMGDAHKESSRRLLLSGNCPARCLDGLRLNYIRVEIRLRRLAGGGGKAFQFAWDRC